MDKYKNILLATDLTEPSMTVAKKCLKLVSQAKDKVHIMHALEVFPTFSWGYGELNTLEQQLEQEAKKQLKNLAAKLGLPSNKVHFKHEPSKKAIINLAIKLKADLIVVGSHSKTGLLGALGSTATSVVSHAPCDVLVIKHVD